MEEAEDITAAVGRAAEAAGRAVVVAGQAEAVVFRAVEAQAEVGKFI